MIDEELWGLDPLFRANVKMYICDVHQMSPYTCEQSNVNRGREGKLTSRG